MIFNKPQDYWASLKANEKALIIETLSGLGMVGIDHLYPPYILPLDADNEILGTVILQALSNSRTLTNEAERIDFFDLKKKNNGILFW